MRISLSTTYKTLSTGMLSDRTAIVVDALRASASMITAIANGCERLIPFFSANDAALIKRNADYDLLLCGEIEGVKAEGFDLGNSPLEYTEENVNEKVIAFASSAGSTTVKKCEEAMASHIFIGTFLNATAVANKALETGEDIVLACAGTNRLLSTDDLIAAGCIMSRIRERKDDIYFDDICKVAMNVYEYCREDVYGYLKENCSHFKTLESLGFDEDIRYCVTEDMFDIVPVCKESVITKK